MSGWGEADSNSSGDGLAWLAAELESRRNLTDLTPIGQGGMGHVYRAYDRGLHRWVAVKAIRPEIVGRGGPDGGDGYQRFLAEMRTLATIRHTSVVNIHYADSADALSATGTAAYFVMDYVDGGDLAEALADRRTTGRRFSVDEACDILRPIAEALDHIHHRNPPVVHRDLKPANILLPRDPHSSVGTTALLTDFGISIAGDDTRVTSTGMVIGTEKYMAPEIFTTASTYGAHMVDYNAATDRYALALIALEMLTLTAFRDTMSMTAWRGERKLPTLTAEALAPQDGPAAAHITSVLRRALDNDPGRRYPTAVAFLDALAAPAGAAGAGRQDAQTRETPVSWAPAPAAAASGASGRRSASRTPVVVLGVLALLVVLGVGGFLGYRHIATPAWDANDARIVNAFPKLLPDRQGESGWQGMTCNSSDARGEEDARVTCRGDGLTMAVVDFGSEDVRAAYIPTTGAEPFEYDGCRIRTVEAAETGGAMSVFPQSADRTRYAMLLTGETVDDAASALDVIQGMPVC
ncbi:serine/threonine-protein kinase [Corynebacterium sp. AOP40-9SA-29]|uniref:serine/threonine-protein kinase n=1 Tax=Corynebacterium sp. AOP40-9SA-29 TaxID=3457677 RepID=UPI00403457CF